VDWQLPIAVTVIASAGSYLGWRGWRSWRASRKGCAGGCGCHKSPAAGAPQNEATLIPAAKLTIRQSPKR
jgi:hypothetical protein